MFIFALFGFGYDCLLYKNTNNIIINKFKELQLT